MHTIGSATRMETRVNIQWPWLALIALAQLATVVYLIRIISMTKRRRWPEWKDSSLATLFHGLDGTTRRDMSTLGSLEDMESATKVLSVRLDLAQGGGKLVGVPAAKAQ